MTVSTSKDVNLAGLNACVAGMAGNPNFDFYICVPEFQFFKFGTVTLQPSPASAWPARIPAGNRWVLSIPVHRMKKRKQEYKIDAEMQLKKAKLDPAAIRELLTKLEADSKGDDAILVAVGSSELQQVSHQPPGGSLYGEFPAGAPKVKVFRNKHGAFAYKLLP